MPERSPESIRVDLQPVGRRAEIAPGQTLLEAAQAAGVELVAICGGGGSCGTCRVRASGDRLSPPTAIERAELRADDLAAGYRLACQTVPLGDVRVDIPPESLTTPQRTQVEGLELAVALDPVVTSCDVQIAPPSLYDLRADDARLSDALAAQGRAPVAIEHSVLSALPDFLRAHGWTARVALRAGEGRPEIVAALPPGTRLLGLAADIGTTKLAAYLVDLASGETLARAGAMNPQIGFGEDVIARIAYADAHADGSRVLRQRLAGSLDALAGDLCASAGARREQVVEAVVVGNTAMHHLFAGLPVHQLGTAPYVPAASSALELRAQDVGLQLAPGARVYLPPNIAGYVGADHVAMLLATGLDRSTETVVALDIGTNTEISVTHRGRLLSCSCASGPAFEGAHIRDGMRAAPGAIERVQIEGDEIRIHTIGGQPPVGLCGSGILDAVAQMLGAGILDARGALRKEHPRVRTGSGRGDASGFVLAWAGETAHGREILVTRRDVNEIQLAKGAIRAGIDILLAEAGVNYDGVDSFVVAGAFGTYLDIGSARRVGMFPDLPRAHYSQVGNAAGMGAKQLLVSARARRTAAEVARRSEYIELTTHAEFTRRFADALAFRTA